MSTISGSHGMQQISLITSIGKPPPAEAGPVTASGLDVCYGSEVDIYGAKRDVRFASKSRPAQRKSRCPLRARSGYYDLVRIGGRLSRYERYRSFIEITLYVASGRRIPFSSNSPIASTDTESSMANSTRGLMRIWPGFASSQRRDATFDTVPMAA
jgi:hypothetical protein